MTATANRDLSCQGLGTKGGDGEQRSRPSELTYLDLAYLGLGADSILGSECYTLNITQRVCLLARQLAETKR